MDNQGAAAGIVQLKAMLDALRTVKGCVAERDAEICELSAEAAAGRIAASQAGVAIAEQIIESAGRGGGAREGDE